MTLPSTPSRSEASPRVLKSPDSPFSVPEELTPRSKVKALLAAIDDDSDFENDAQSCQSQANESTRIPAQNSPGSNPSRGQFFPDYDGTDEEERDEAPIAPRGRLAARLQAHNVSRSSLNTTKDQEFDETPYDRIRNQLLRTAETVSKEHLVDSMSNSGENSNRKPENPTSGLDEPKSPFEASGSQRSSPRLFLTPKAVNPSQSPRNLVISNGSGSDSDLPANPQTSKRLQILVARKREERRMKEAAEAQRHAEKKARHKAQPQAPKIGSSHHDFTSAGSSSENSDNQAGDRRLTQQTRPTRKASKKALEEMNRETQRMSRNMQLAHQAKTKKKITKESFFTRFNLGINGLKTASVPQNPSSSTAMSSTPASDVDLKRNDSPPTSPQEPDDLLYKVQESGEAMITAEDVREVLPNDLFVLPRPSQMSLTLSNQAIQSSRKTMEKNSKTTPNLRLTDPSFRLQLPKTSLRPVPVDMDSDSDLEIVANPTPKKSKFAVFDRLSAGVIKEERSLQNLRVLAHMQTPGKRTSSSKPSVTMLDMQTSLQQRARKQAAAERAEKIQCLKDKGVTILSAEERQKDQAEVEDLVEKARKEANAIMEKEKRAANKQKTLNKDKLFTELTSDEDEDYQGNDADQSDMDFSGSNEEDASGDEQQDDECIAGDQLADKNMEESVRSIQSEANQEPLIDVEASEDGAVESQIEEDFHPSHDDSDVMVPRRKPRVSRLIIDDNSSEDDETRKQQLPTTPCEIFQMPLIPDIPFANALPMGMTQAFAATMADTQTQEVDDLDQGQDSMRFTDAIPKRDFTTCGLDVSQQMILDSQISLENRDVNQEESMDLKLSLSQSPSHDHASEDERDLETGTQYSEIPDPTQDVGFIISPIHTRFVSVPPSTIDTVLLSGERNTPVFKRKGRLRRGVDTSTKAVDNEEDIQAPEVTAFSQITADAFDVLKKAARKPNQKAEIYDKTKSEAKGLVDEQAQESEDEYAGLGGASDDESAGEEDEEVRKMMDEGEVEVDEGKLAAFYA